jgi:lipid II:glycine glycyltransferase (peptidoglycan interpeptide bridge formation enzyme)
MALFQSWVWGEVVRAEDHSVWRLGWYDGEALVAVAQVQKVTARRGTFLHVRHGPILSNQKKSLWNIVLSDLEALAKREKAWFIRVSPLLGITREHQQLYKDLGLRNAPIHAMDAELCWVLDLDKSEEEILADMRKTTRYEIRRAEKLGVTVDTGLKDFFALYTRTSKRHGFVPHSGIQEELEVFGNNAIVYNAAHEGKTIASAIILFWADEAIYHHGASIPSKIPASYLIQWEAIREAKKRGKKLYNFWGIAPEDNANHPWRGITLFKKGFGGREMEFMHAQDYTVSPLYILPKTIEQIRKCFKGY